jgi:hypothetical protein
METRRFDELTVALARGGSRRGALRGLAAGVLGALALNRSGALAKSDKDKPEQGGGKPITILAKPLCTAGTVSADCPLCAEARKDPLCCDQTLLAAGYDQACGSSAVDNDGNSLGLTCTAANANCNSCLEAQCTSRESGAERCTYTKTAKFCTGKSVCCNDFTSNNFGTCVTNRNSC